MPANPSPLTAPTAEDFRAWYRVQCAAFAHDRPGEPLPSQAAVQARLAATDRHRHVLWLLRGTADEPVATASLRLPAQGTATGSAAASASAAASGAPDTGPGQGPAATGARTGGQGAVAEIRLTVHPAHRRLGTGSRLLSTVTEAALAAGCGGVVGEVVCGTSGEGFLATRDFLPVLRRTWQRLPLAEIPDPVGKLPGVPHPGYRLTAWEGAPPAALAGGFAAALRTLPALPPDTGLAPGETRWDPDHVPDAVRLAAGRGDRLLTVAALHDGPDGAEDAGGLAGHTTVLLPGDGTGPALQYGTAVVPAHRGNGLGLWMKAELLRRLAAAGPGVTELHTAVPDDNRHMLAVNAALGFRPLRRSVRYRLRLRRR